MKNNKWQKWLAIALCVVVGVLANESTDLQKQLFGGHVIMGGPMLALLFTMILCNILPSVSKPFKEGTTFCSKKLLNWGIIVTGATLNFANLGGLLKALPLLIVNILLAFLVAIVVGSKVLKVSEETSILVGSGTSICGGTAIGTIARIIKASEEDIAFAMAAIFLFDTLAAFSYPYLANAMGFNDMQFAYLAGAAVNDASSVAGAQETWKHLSGSMDFNGAVTVKLVRTTLLIFVALAWTLIMAGRAKKNGEAAANDSAVAVVVKTFPTFILWFVAMAALNTYGVFSEKGVALMKDVGKYLFAAALAGVGFKIKFKDVFSKGVKPIALGGITWLAVFLCTMAFCLLFKGYIG